MSACQPKRAVFTFQVERFTGHNIKNIDDSKASLTFACRRTSELE